MGREGRGKGREMEKERDEIERVGVTQEWRSVQIGPPQDHFGWATGIGVCHGDILTSKVIDAEGDDVIGSILSQQNLMSFPHDKKPSEQNTASDTSADSLPNMAITPWGELQSILLLDFHIAFLYSHRLILVSRLRDRIVMEVPFDVTFFPIYISTKIYLFFSFFKERMVGMCDDVLNDTIWIFGERAVYELNVQDEEKDVWKDYLYLKQFTLASLYTHTVAERNLVFSREADHAFRVSNWECVRLCLCLYTCMSFEESY